MLKTIDCKIRGVLVEKHCILGYSLDKGSNWIMINLVIETDDKGNRVNLSLFSNELTANGQKSKVYEGLFTVMQEYNSLNSTIKNKRTDKDAKAEVDKETTVRSKDECELIEIKKDVQMQMNRYMSNGELRENLRLSSRFVNRARNLDDKECYCEASLFGIVTKQAIDREDRNGERYLSFELTCPTYREPYGDREESIVVEKFNLIVRKDEKLEIDDEILDLCMDEFVQNAVVKVGVSPIDMIIESAPVETKGVKFGKKVDFEPTSERITEIRVIGLDEIEEEDWVEDPNFNFELYEKALVEFDKKIEEIKNNVNVNSPSENGRAPKGFGARKQASKVSEEDIPF